MGVFYHILSESLWYDVIKKETRGTLLDRQVSQTEDLVNTEREKQQQKKRSQLHKWVSLQLFWD